MPGDENCQCDMCRAARQFLQAQPMTPFPCPPNLSGAPQPLTELDIERIARRVVELLAERLAKP